MSPMQAGTLPPPPQPIDPPQPKKSSVNIPAWIPLGLSIVLIIVNQVMISLRAFPPNEPLTITLAILTVLSASIPLILQQIAQAQAVGTQRLQMQMSNARAIDQMRH